jgi:predicted nicotinamide N-methyase
MQADSAARRARALEAWLSSQTDRDVEDVTLPISGRRYTIYKPDEPSRERLFAEARRDPDKQMPHWARVWPSGVALADVVTARRDELAGRRVLELGCGLGVTAITALEAGATLVVSDYSALPLTFCRYNALQNVGRSPRSLQFNWRAPTPSALLRARVAGGFPLILAADVLYEGRDVQPLLDLIESLLAPDGMLWLAEPGRKTAQRFLNTAAAAGWQGVSTSANGPWPDGSTDHVGLHFLRRATYLDQLPGNLGGWRM